MRFFEAAADWADRKSVDLKFARDEYDGWFAIIQFSDSRGPFSTVVNRVEPTSKTECDSHFGERVSKMLDKACVAARTNRIRVVAKTAPRAAA